MDTGDLIRVWDDLHPGTPWRTLSTDLRTRISRFGMTLQKEARRQIIYAILTRLMETGRISSNLSDSEFTHLEEK